MREMKYREGGSGEGVRKDGIKKNKSMSKCRPHLGPAGFARMSMNEFVYEWVCTMGRVDMCACVCVCRCPRSGCIIGSLGSWNWASSVPKLSVKAAQCFAESSHIRPSIHLFIPPPIIFWIIVIFFLLPFVVFCFFFAVAWAGGTASHNASSRMRSRRETVGQSQPHQRPRAK